MLGFICIAAIEASVFYFLGRVHGLASGYKIGQIEKAMAQESMARIVTKFVKKQGLNTEWLAFIEDGSRKSLAALSKKGE